MGSQPELVSEVPDAAEAIWISLVAGRDWVIPVWVAVPSSCRFPIPMIERYWRAELVLDRWEHEALRTDHCQMNPLSSKPPKQFVIRIIVIIMIRIIEDDFKCKYIIGSR